MSEFAHLVRSLSCWMLERFKHGSCTLAVPRLGPKKRRAFRAALRSSRTAQTEGVRTLVEPFHSSLSGDPLLLTTTYQGMGEARKSDPTRASRRFKHPSFNNKLLYLNGISKGGWNSPTETSLSFSH